MEKSVNESQVAAKAPSNVETIPQQDVWNKKMFSFKPEMFQTFYVFLGISFLLIFLILFRMFRYLSF